MAFFQVGVSDLLTVTKLAWDLYHNCYLVAKEAPDDFRLLVNELGSLQGVLRNLRDDVSSDRSFVDKLGENRKENLERCLRACSDTLRKLQDLVIKYKDLGLHDGAQFWKKLKWVTKQGEIADLKSRIMVHTCNISLCLSSIGNSSLARIEASMLRALEHQDAIQDDFKQDDYGDTMPLMRAKTSSSDTARPDNDGAKGISRQFTGLTATTLVEPARNVSPDLTPSISEEDGSEHGGQPLNDLRTHRKSTSSAGSRQSPRVNVIRDWRAHPPSPVRSVTDVRDGSRPYSSSVTDTRDGSRPYTTSLADIRDGSRQYSTFRTYIRDSSAPYATPSRTALPIEEESGVSEAVEAAIKELYKIRQKEQTAKPLRIRRRDSMHKPFESLKSYFLSLSQEEIDYRGLNTKDWLRIGTWWLLKAKFRIEAAKALEPLTSEDSISLPSLTTTYHQAYLDLLKASWILYDIILNSENLTPLQSDENRKLFFHLSDELHEQLRSYPEARIFNQERVKELKYLECHVFEHEQPEEENQEIDDLLSGLDNSRWITVEQDDAGDYSEDVLFRTFVDAAIGGKTLRVRSKDAPYLLMLYSKEGESEMKVVLCNQRCTLCLSRNLTPEDLFEPSQSSAISSGLLSSASAGSEILPLNFGQLNVLVAFQSDAELRAFMSRPKVYFQAVRTREPQRLAKGTESLIFNSSVEVIERLHTSTLKPAHQKDIFSSCDLRILETVTNEAWNTTRRLVISSSAGVDRPWCKNFFLPLSRVQLTREEIPRRVLARWSDCTREKYDRTDGEWHTIYTHVYDDSNPNLAFSFLFPTQADADRFVDTVLHLSQRPIFDWTSDPNSLSGGCVYDVSDTEPKPKSYKALILTHTHLRWTYSDVFYQYRNTDLEYNCSSRRVRFPQLYYTDYISSHVEKLYAPSPDKPVRFSHCDKKFNCVTADFEDDALAEAFLSSLASAYTLIFARRAVYISSKAPSRLSFRRSSSDASKGPVDIQLWRKGNNMRLVSRWGDAVEDKYMSMNVDAASVSMPRDTNRVDVSRTDYECGRKIDMANMMALDPREKGKEKGTATMRIAFETVRDGEVFMARLTGREDPTTMSTIDEVLGRLSVHR